MIESGAEGEVLRSFKSLHAAVAQLQTSHVASSNVVDWVASVSADSSFVAADYRRLLPRDRVNVVGTLSVGGSAAAVTAAAATAAAAGHQQAGSMSAAAWDELRQKVEQAEREKTDLEWKAAMDAKLLKHKLSESERRRHELKRQLKRVMPVSSMSTSAKYCHRHVCLSVCLLLVCSH